MIEHCVTMSGGSVHIVDRATSFNNLTIAVPWSSSDCEELGDWASCVAVKICEKIGQWTVNRFPVGSLKEEVKRLAFFDFRSQK